MEGMISKTEYLDFFQTGKLVKTDIISVTIHDMLSKSMEEFPRYLSLRLSGTDLLEIMDYKAISADTEGNVQLLVTYNVRRLKKHLERENHSCEERVDECREYVEKWLQDIDHKSENAFHDDELKEAYIDEHNRILDVMDILGISHDGITRK